MTQEFSFSIIFTRPLVPTLNEPFHHCILHYSRNVLATKNPSSPNLQCQSQHRSDSSPPYHSSCFPLWAANDGCTGTDNRVPAALSLEPSIKAFIWCSGSDHLLSTRLRMLFKSPGILSPNKASSYKHLTSSTNYEQTHLPGSSASPSSLASPDLPRSSVMLPSR